MWRQFLIFFLMIFSLSSSAITPEREKSYQELMDWSDEFNLKLPRDPHELFSLINLSLKGENITYLPPAIGDLYLLGELKLSNNYITTGNRKS